MRSKTPQSKPEEGGYIARNLIDSPESLHLRQGPCKDMVYPFPGIIGHCSLSDEAVLSFLAVVVTQHGKALLDAPLTATQRVDVAQAIALCEWICVQNGADNELHSGSSRALEIGFGLPPLAAAGRKGESAQ
jgi:hypothetical protein